MFWIFALAWMFRFYNLTPIGLRISLLYFVQLYSKLLMDMLVEGSSDSASDMGSGNQLVSETVYRLDDEYIELWDLDGWAVVF